jgi:hypothetical protein
MKFLTNSEYDQHLKERSDAYAKGYAKGLEEGRSKAHEEDFVQDISFTDVEYVFDFHLMKVFSIERTHVGSGGEQTVIGYILDGDNRQWYLQCSRSHHNKLVAQWQEARLHPYVKKK